MESELTCIGAAAFSARRVEALIARATLDETGPKSVSASSTKAIV